MATSNHRKIPSRAELPRRTTRGPLDDDGDSLSATLSPSSLQSNKTSALVSASVQSQELPPPAQPLEAQASLLEDQPDDETRLAPAEEKNLSFLLDKSNFHPLSQVDVPTAFRKPFPGPPPPGSTSDQILALVESLIAKCDFLGAAHLAVICLTFGFVKPIDHAIIFRLLATRFSCLEIMGQTLLAAQEAKALEDLSSEFYYTAKEVSEAEPEAHDGQRPIAQHLMPFSLRVQAIRLQTIGFSDPRRGITMLYDLGLEVRENISSPYTSDLERQEWHRRLESLNMHVVNALVELGDLDCAQRTLSQSMPTDPKAQSRWSNRLVLMHVKLGQVSRAQEIVDSLHSANSMKVLLASLVAMADGRVEPAVEALRAASKETVNSEMGAIARQNLAVALLYHGQIAEAKEMLEALIEGGYSFPSLTVNLATVFDLTSDKSREQKTALIDKLASSQNQKRPFTNADFKL